MKTSDFYFDLPEELIAQVPILDRSSSKLMVLDKETGEIEHKTFKNVIDYLNPGDCLVLNNTRVIPARLIGEKVDTGGKIEFLLLKRTEEDTWQALVKPGKRAKIGTKFSFGNGKLIGEVVGLAEEGSRIIKFHYEGIFEEVLDELGNMPLPPYITERLEERERYQTVYSKHNGSAAAPTAGLHFTEELLQQIKDKGVEIAFVTLHVGLGTFRPVKVDDVLEHEMHSEYYMVDKEAAQKINNAKKNGHNVVCVGTTSCRTVESATNEEGIIEETSGWTNIFIYPGYKFKMVDKLITNFHLPESTLIMLVSALSSKENVLNAYETAVKERYRFFSFGDAMIDYDLLQIKTLGSQVNTVTHFLPNKWYHVAFVHDASGLLTIYINGVKDVTLQTKGGPLTFTFLEMVCSGSTYFKNNCKLAQVRLWRKAITPTQIISNMYYAVKSTDPNLMGYWKLDEGQGNMFEDCTGQGRDMTVEDELKWEKDVRFDK